jgi:HSP20 family protein
MIPVLRASVPFSPFAGLTFNRLDSLFNQFSGDAGNGLVPSRTGNIVPLSIWQDDDNIFLEAELPGVKDGDLEITVHNGELTIKGERRAEEGREYLYNGRRFGPFERVVALPEAVDSAQVDATLTSGVLRVRLPKLPEARPRKITLKTS